MELNRVWAIAAIAGGCFILAFVLGSLVEYWVHRLMHKPYKVGQRHRNHHKSNTAQGVLWEFRDYVRGTVVVFFPLFWVSWWAGLGWVCGCLAYAAFSSYAHQLQHENPTRCFWMKMPVHYVHHKYNQWHHNFGLAVDWWDHVFGTYKPMEWRTEAEEALAQRPWTELRWW